MKIFQLIEFHAEDADDDPESYGNMPNPLFPSFAAAHIAACNLMKQSCDALEIEVPTIEFTEHVTADWQMDVVRWWSYEAPSAHDIEFSIYETNVV